MKITEAVRELEQGKTINSANAQATIKPFEVENQKRVLVTCVKQDGREDVMDLSLTRLQQVYSAHDFAMGQYKSTAPTDKKPAAPAETK